MMPVQSPLPPSSRHPQQRRAGMAGDLLPLGDWIRHHSLRSWPVVLFPLLGIIIRPEQVTRPMLILMTVIAMATQVPLAVTLEVDLHADTAGLGPSIWSVGLPEELAKAMPVAAIVETMSEESGTQVTVTT